MGMEVAATMTAAFIGLVLSLTPKPDLLLHFRPRAVCSSRLPPTPYLPFNATAPYPTHGVLQFATLPVQEGIFFETRCERERLL
jgi:hypothetical protein